MPIKLFRYDSEEIRSILANVFEVERDAIEGPLSDVIVPAPPDELDLRAVKALRVHELANLLGVPATLLVRQLGVKSVRTQLSEIDESTLVRTETAQRIEPMLRQAVEQGREVECTLEGGEESKRPARVSGPVDIYSDDHTGMHVLVGRSGEGIWNAYTRTQSPTLSRVVDVKFIEPVGGGRDMIETESALPDEPTERPEVQPRRELSLLPCQVDALAWIGKRVQWRRKHAEQWVEGVVTYESDALVSMLTNVGDHRSERTFVRRDVEVRLDERDELDVDGTSIDAARETFRHTIAELSRATVLVQREELATEVDPRNLVAVTPPMPKTLDTVPARKPQVDLVITAIGSSDDAVKGTARMFETVVGAGFVVDRIEGRKIYGHTDADVKARFLVWASKQQHWAESVVIVGSPEHDALVEAEFEAYDSEWCADVCKALDTEQTPEQIETFVRDAAERGQRVRLTTERNGIIEGLADYDLSDEEPLGCHGTDGAWWFARDEVTRAEVLT